MEAINMSIKKGELTRSELRKIDYEVATNADKFDKKLFNQIYKASDNLKKIEQEHAETVPTAHEFMNDVFAGLYKMNPEVREDASPQLAMNKQLMEYLLNNEDFKNYREYTRLDDLGAVLGTTKYSYSALEWLQEERKQNQSLDDAMKQMQQAMQQQEQQQNGGNNGQNNGQSEGDSQQGGGEGNNTPNPLQQAQQQLEQALQDAINGNSKLQKALTQSGEDAKDENEKLKALLGDAGTGTNGTNKIPLAERIQLAETLSNNNKIKKIAEWAGRFKAIARQKQKSKSNASHSKQGLTLGNEIANLVPNELLMFSQAGTKLDFLRRFSEQQLLQFENKGKQPEGKGAIICCLDQSGSMQDLDEQSKGFVLALAMIAKKQRREFAFIPFDDGVGKTRIFEKGKISSADIVSMAGEFMGGGTNFVKPLNTALDILKMSKFKKADIVFITDGSCNVPETFQKMFAEIKKQKEFQMLSVIIGSSNLSKNHVLHAISNNVVCAENFNDDKVMSKAFTI